MGTRIQAGRALMDLPMIAKMFTMIRGEDHQCVLAQSQFVQVIQDPSDFLIHMADQCIVTAAYAYPFLIAESQALTL